MTKFFNPTQLKFGNYLDHLKDEVGTRRTLLVTTQGQIRRGFADPQGLPSTIVAAVNDVPENPSINYIDEAAQKIRGINFESIIALGGGSVLDTAKALATLTTGSQASIKSYLIDDKVFGQNFTPKPMIAIPTTAGTGSEATKWATIWDPEADKKYSLTHEKLYPKFAILDPHLTVTAPRSLTIASGLDALSHAMEAIWNNNHNDESDTYAKKSIAEIFETLVPLSNDLTNLTLRGKMQQASSYAALAFSNTRTALAHSMSYPITLTYGVPHGIACSFTLAEILVANDHANPQRCQHIVEALEAQSVQAAKEKIEDFFNQLEIKNLLPDSLDIELLEGRLINPARASNNVASVSESQAADLIKRAFARAQEN